MSEPSPFDTLGKHLRYVREELQQSLEEVSGAVEIDEQLLARIEAGEERPTEDILLLLISYFGVRDYEAVRLWELADYATDLPEQLQPDIDNQTGKVVMLLAMDMRTIYSDGLDITTTPAGITLGFTQAGSRGRQTPVARIGMSHQQAQQILTQLAQALLAAKYNQGPRRLSAGDPPERHV